MKRILVALTGILLALGLTFVAAPASAAPASSDDVGIMAVVGTFAPSGTPLLNNQVCTPITPGDTTVTFNALAVDFDLRLAWFSDATCATQVGMFIQPPSPPGGNIIPPGALFYSTT